jgi:hypothetical protein
VSTTFVRSAVVLTAYLLSSLGLLLMLQLVNEEFRSPNPNWFVAVWIGAWIAHLKMSIAWVRDTQLHRFWPICGAILGFGSFLIWPVAAAGKNAGPADSISAVPTLMIAQLVLIAPCALLGVWLLRFRSLQRVQPPCRTGPSGI